MMSQRRSIVMSAGLLRCLMALAFALPLASMARAEESLGEKIKHALKPTPTPTPHRKKKKKIVESSDDEKKSSPAPEKSASPKPKAGASPPAKKKPKPGSDDEENDQPAKKSTARKKGSASPTPTPANTPTESPSPTATPEASPATSPIPPAVAPPNEKKKGAPSSIPPGDIADYEKYPPNLRKITDLGLDLAGRNLQYKYGSADPSNGGMDCSGFVHYVLTQTGLHDVPRDSSQQYVWARKAGTFRAVNSRADDSFELNELKPGDLLFWTGTYSIERDPPITHAMIYLGREKGTGNRVMVGASDGRSYKGESRFGVSVFDFKIAHPPRDKDAKLTPTFIGYAHVPGLNDG